MRSPLDVGAMAGDTAPLRVLEFYSGIGGLRYSLEKCGAKAVLVEAFDINEVANDVYEHNFGHRPSQGNIQGLSVQQLDKYKADAWLMSPPCQPYTRQGLQKDADDARASSFLKIMQLLPLMASPPTNLLVENVVGFENSVTHGRLLAVLEDAGFAVQEFILSPLQFGIPYSRPRYFCLAKGTSESFAQPECNGQLLCRPGPLLRASGPESNAHAVGESTDSKTGGFGVQSGDGKVASANESSENRVSSAIQSRRNEPVIDPAVECGTVGDYLEASPAHALEESIESQSFGSRSSRRDGAASPKDTGPDGPRLDRAELTGDSEQAISSGERSTGRLSDDDQWQPYHVPMSVVERWIDAYDIVTPQSSRCCCFTKSYTRYAKGTGSFLATKVSLIEGETTLEKHIFDLRLEGRSLASLGLRYFTPREVANLHSFPDTFRFPPHIKLKQRYALLGNSLSVAVVGGLLRYLFSTPALWEPSVGQ